MPIVTWGSSALSAAIDEASLPNRIEHAIGDPTSGFGVVCFDPAATRLTRPFLTTLLEVTARRPRPERTQNRPKTAAAIKAEQLEREADELDGGPEGWLSAILHVSAPLAAASAVSVSVGAFSILRRRRSRRRLGARDGGSLAIEFFLDPT